MSPWKQPINADYLAYVLTDLEGRLVTGAPKHFRVEEIKQWTAATTDFLEYVKEEFKYRNELERGGKR